MAKIRVIINGREVLAPLGVTILEAARQAGIDIPTLCHHPALKPVGICRMCLVEVKGLRTLQPACTFPISEGMEIQTEIPAGGSRGNSFWTCSFPKEIISARTARSAATANCSPWGTGTASTTGCTRPTPRRSRSTASHKYLVMEHNRCVLCRRCVRACGELAANHTLGLRERGIESMIHADANVPFGESTCISCGSCAQVCPTGSLVDAGAPSWAAATRRSTSRAPATSAASDAAWRSSPAAATSFASRATGMQPSTAGCSAKAAASTRSTMSARGSPSPCCAGRENSSRQAGTKRSRPSPSDSTIREAKEIGLLVLERCDQRGALPRRPSVPAGAARQECRPAYRAAPEWIGKKPGTFADLIGSDMILVVGANPVKDQPVASFLIKRLRRQGDAAASSSTTGKTGLPPLPKRP